VAERPTSIGRAIPGVEVAILRDDGTEAGPDEIGEIVHRGEFVFLRYWGDPEATARARRPDPLAPEAGRDSAPALFTGDLGRMDADGFLYFEGRRDHMIKSMGVRVSPVEVEELLLASGLVEEAAVFGIPHPVNGQEVCAAVVSQAPPEETRKALVRFARQEMSAYMIPRRYLLLDSLPRTSSGKVDYPALRAAIPEN
jgi:acyl-CoA synthetase (AMP-forming)/AMP-acid ligase II